MKIERKPLSPYYSDGFTIGSNPSEFGGGYTVMDSNDAVLITKTIERPNYTNNEAEFSGLEYAAEIAGQGDSIIVDSMVCIHWIKSGKSKSRPDLNSRLQQIKKKILEKNLNVEWKPRDENLAGQHNEFVLQL